MNAGCDLSVDNADAGRIIIFLILGSETDPVRKLGKIGTYRNLITERIDKAVVRIRQRIRRENDTLDFFGVTDGNAVGAELPEHFTDGVRSILCRFDLNFNPTHIIYRINPLLF